MQVPTSYLATSYSTPTMVAKQSSSQIQNGRTGLSLEQMLDNLREDPAISEQVSETEDGRYTFDWKGLTWSEKSFAASAIVMEMNDQNFSLIDNSDAIYQPLDSDTALFKKMTGYNMVELGGTLVVLDDQGFPPSSEDKASVQQAFDFVVDLASFRGSGYLDGELTAENVGILLTAYDISPGESGFLDQLLRELGYKPASVELTSQEIQIKDEQIEDLMDLVSSASVPAQSPIEVRQ